MISLVGNPFRSKGNFRIRYINILRCPSFIISDTIFPRPQFDENYVSTSSNIGLFLFMRECVSKSYLDFLEVDGLFGDHFKYECFVVLEIVSYLYNLNTFFLHNPIKLTLSSKNKRSISLQYVKRQTMNNIMTE